MILLQAPKSFLQIFPNLHYDTIQKINQRSLIKYYSLKGLVHLNYYIFAITIKNIIIVFVSIYVRYLFADMGKTGMVIWIIPEEESAIIKLDKDGRQYQEVKTVKLDSIALTLD